MTIIHIDRRESAGPLETWRHSLGQGGINPLPLPERVVAGTAKLQPRLIRIFIQEFFAIYPGNGRFNWSKLDPYMDALFRTGANIIAAITIKPKALYPEIRQDTWQPNNIKEWQYVIGALVQRYSVEKQIVTHWEIGNEVDIGEDGGSPYRIQDPKAYADYYTMTIQPILEVFPQAKVGGPAMASMHSEPLPGFIRHCQQTNTPLDFLTWHLYHSDPGRHAYQVQLARLLASKLPKMPEFMVTEWSTQPSAWNGGMNADSSAEQAFDLRRTAFTAAAIIDMCQVGLDGSFYYHLWDQVCNPDDFTPFFSPSGVDNMVHHWNEFPHRLGLFGVDAQVRPQYFVFLMLSKLGEERVKTMSDDFAVRVLGGKSATGVSMMMVNHGIDDQRDRLVTLQFANLQPGFKQLTLYRIDHTSHWDNQTLELLPVEKRETCTRQNFSWQVWLPKNSVAMVNLDTLQR